ncbi:hypothetical protein [Leucobacter luti]|uniref:hypothetical protein n=1 Tax=Leucobacter luti TaxID=340320 RepID=UPI003CFBCDDC
MRLFRIRTHAVAVAGALGLVAGLFAPSAPFLPTDAPAIAEPLAPDASEGAPHSAPTGDGPEAPPEAPQEGQTQDPGQDPGANPGQDPGANSGQDPEQDPGSAETEEPSAPESETPGPPAPQNAPSPIAAAAESAAVAAQIAASPGCSYADAGSGAFAKSICWINMDGLTTQYDAVVDPKTTAGTTCVNVLGLYTCTSTGTFTSRMGSAHGNYRVQGLPGVPSTNQATARANALDAFWPVFDTTTPLYRATPDGTYWGPVANVPVSFPLSSALSFEAEIDIALDSGSLSGRGVAVQAAGIPTSSLAGLGNNGLYTGIAGKPAILQPAIYDTGVTTNTVVTMDNIVLRRSNGSVVTGGYSIVGADAGATTALESVAWATVDGDGFRWLPNDPVAWAAAPNDSARKDAAVGTNGCGATLAVEFNPLADIIPIPVRDCVGTGSGARDGAAMVRTSPLGLPLIPFSVTQRVQSGGTQAVAFGILTTGAQINVAVQDRIVNTSGAPTTTDFRATLTPTSGGFGAADAVTSSTGPTALAGTPQELRVPAVDGGFQFNFAATTASDPYLSSYTQNWVCSKTSSTSMSSTPWSGNGTPENPQPSPPPASWSLLQDGEFAECTVTYIPPYLTLKKQVDNAAGGAASPADWTIAGASPVSAITGRTGEATVTRVPVAIGDYAITEAGAPADYRWESLSCDGPAGSTHTTPSPGGGIASGGVTMAKLDDTTCTLTNRFVGAHLTLEKRVESTHGGGAQPGDFTLAAAGPTPGISGVTGSAAVTNVPVDPGNYTLSESGGPAGYAGAWECSDGATSLPVSAAGVVEVPAAGNVSCRITNRDLPGTVVWTKVDESGTPIGGSEWVLTGPGIPAAGVVIPDCEAAPCTGSGPHDTNPAPGGFAIGGLSWGEHELVELTAPPGFLRDSATHRLAIGPTAPAQLAWDLGNIENVRITAPAIPLTGGLSTLAFVLGGGGFLLLTAVAVARQQIRRRRALLG